MLNKRKTKKKSGKPLGDAQFLALPHQVIRSVAYRSLSSHAAKLLIDLGVQYNGKNNGDLSAAFSVFKRDRGWRSSGTLSRAIKELIKYGLISKTRQGGKNQCSLYALSFRNIDSCNGKLDVESTCSPRNEWKEFEPKQPLPIVNIEESKKIAKGRLEKDIMKNIMEYAKLNKN